MFWNGRTEKHQTSTARFRLAEENGQHRPFPSLACVLPHPLQNRVPRGERAPVALCCEPTEPAGETKSFCPCQKQRYCFCSGAVFCHWAERLGNEVRPQARLRCVSWGPAARWAASRPDRGGSRDKSDVHLCWVFPSVLPCSQPFPSPPAPKTHPTSAVFA